MVICEVDIAIATELAEVILPLESTVNLDTCDTEPVEVAVTFSARLKSTTVPESLVAASDVIQEGLAYETEVYIPSVTVPALPEVLIAYVTPDVAAGAFNTFLTNAVVANEVLLVLAFIVAASTSPVNVPPALAIFLDSRSSIAS